MVAVGPEVRLEITYEDRETCILTDQQDSLTRIVIDINLNIQR